MKKNICYLTFLLVFLSCTKEQGVPGPTGTQGPAGANGANSTDTASIVGSVRMYDEFSNLQNNASGVTVTLIDGQTQHTATTDSSGHYAFPGIATGTYDLSFQKAGYGTMMIFGLSHFGGGTLPTTVENIIVLQKPGKTAPENFTLVSSNSNTTTFDLVLDTSSLTYVQIQQDFLVFIGHNPNVGPMNYDILLNTFVNPDGAGGYTVNFFKANPTEYIPPTITTGDTLYAMACTYNQYVRIPGVANGYTTWGLASYYMDPLSGKYIYPNISGPTSILKFVY